ncbi:MAG: hypothetical protein RIS86_418, partial [Planctomycetota bacterium]
SPDRSRWIACGDGPEVSLVDLATGTVRPTTMPEGTAMVWGACFSPDGSRIFLASESGVHELLEDGTVVLRRKQPIGQARGLVVVEGDGLWLLAGSMQLQRYDLDDWSVESFPVSPGGNIIGGLATDGRGRFYVAGGDGRQRAFDLVLEQAAGDDAPPRRTLVEDAGFRPPARRGGVCSVALSPDGATVAFGTVWGEVLLLDARTGALGRAVPAIHSVWSLAYMPPGDALVAGDRGGRLHLLDLAGDGGGQVDVLPTDSKEPAWANAPIGDGRIVVNVGDTVKIVDATARWSQRQPDSPGGRPYGVSRFDGRRLRVIALDGSVRELDCDAGAWTVVMPPADADIGFGAIPRDGRRVARSVGERIEILEPGAAETDARVVAQMPGAARVRMSWSSEGDLLAISSGGTVRVVDAEGRELQREPEGTQGRPTSVVWFGPERFASFAWTDGARASEHVLGQPAPRADRQGLPMPSTFTPTYSGGRWSAGTFAGPILLSAPGGFEALARIEESHTLFEGQDDAVHAAVVSPDGSLLATGGSDGRVILWRAADGEPLLSFPPVGEQVFVVEWSEDGRSLVAIGARGAVRLYDSVPRAERLASGAGG